MLARIAVALQQRLRQPGDHVAVTGIGCRRSGLWASAELRAPSAGHPGTIQRVSGARDELPGTRSRGVHRDPHRNRDAAEGRDVGGLQLEEYPLEGLHRVLAAGLRQHDHELVRARAADHVARAREPVEDAPDRAEDVVGDLTAVIGVERPEAVHVDDGEREIAPVPPATGDLGLEVPLECLQVGQLRERIAQPARLQLALQLAYPVASGSELLLELHIGVLLA